MCRFQMRKCADKRKMCKFKCADVQMKNDDQILNDQMSFAEL
jgi:hypothetical protein